jgi:hypothetical protein
VLALLAMRFVFVLAAASFVVQDQSVPALPSPSPSSRTSAFDSPDTAAAAKCRVTEVRQVGLEKLIKLGCPDNRLSMQAWLAPHEKAPWLVKDIWTTVVPTGMTQDVHISPGRAPRSDYTRPKPVHVLIAAGNSGKVTATLVSLTFH